MCGQASRIFLGYTRGKKADVQTDMEKSEASFNEWRLNVTLNAEQRQVTWPDAYSDDHLMAKSTIAPASASAANLRLALCSLLGLGQHAGATVAEHLAHKPRVAAVDANEALEILLAAAHKKSVSIRVPAPVSEIPQLHESTMVFARCSICLESKPLHQFLFLPKCGHGFCEECADPASQLYNCPSCRSILPRFPPMRPHRVYFDEVDPAADEKEARIIEEAVAHAARLMGELDAPHAGATIAANVRSAPAEIERFTHTHTRLLDDETRNALIHAAEGLTHRLDGALAEEQQKTAELSGELGDVRNQLRGARAQLDHDRDELAVAQSAREVAEQQFGQQRENALSWSARCSELEKEVAILRDQLARGQVERAQLEKGVTVHGETLNELLKKIQLRDQQMDVFQEKVQRRNERISRNHDTIRRLNAELKQSEMQVDRLEDKVDELSEKAHRYRKERQVMEEERYQMAEEMKRKDKELTVTDFSLYRMND
ncbi:hypothetical protein FISHEDRAFT_55181 [Fistulina hepatica ATCC 64428]|uniref:RING-type domain-containing protein n=1 Tax=Fistulina hepatica ATCC 64428 TaxID=1128425 RepID=A0A0D7AQ53_9AGAR|nr:hypothetical protein FISHEDRAFT_55181 [Fistulina hepatica ATCC 64428]